MVQTKEESSSTLYEKSRTRSIKNLVGFFNNGGTPSEIPQESIQAPGSRTKTIHLLLCEQIVKEVIISETTTANSQLPSREENPGAAQLPSVQLQPRSSISSETSLPPIPPAQHTALLTPEYIKRFRNKKLTKHLAWKDDRRAVSSTDSFSTHLAHAQHFHGFRTLFSLETILIDLFS